MFAIRSTVHLLDELLSRFWASAPDWTQFNRSDPGVTLTELFDFLAEPIGGARPRRPRVAIAVASLGIAAAIAVLGRRRSSRRRLCGRRC